MAQTEAEPATAEASEDKTLGQLVALAERDLAHLLRSEIELAKAEITADLKRGGLGGGLLGGGLFFIYVAVLFLSVTAALALGLVLPTVVGFAIIGGLYLLLGALLALVALVNVRRLNLARRTRQTIQEAIALLKRGKQPSAQS